MRCPYCHQNDDRVVNSRSSADGTTVKRRRECNQCGRRYTTYERIEQSVLRVVKKDGSREDFSRAKIRSGLMKACYKRPIPTEDVDQMVAEIERELNQQYEKEVPSDAVGELLMEKLRSTDDVAYIRFASVYREFKDVTQFVEEADTLRGGQQQEDAEGGQE
jgi:transcriptional repressor NrdR